MKSLSWDKNNPGNGIGANKNTEWGIIKLR